MDSALAAAFAQLDSLRGQIVTLAARESDLQGEFVAWTDAYTLASDRVEKLIVHRRYVTQQFAAAGGDLLRLHALLWPAPGSRPACGTCRTGATLWRHTRLRSATWCACRPSCSG